MRRVLILLCLVGMLGCNKAAPSTDKLVSTEESKPTREPKWVRTHVFGVKDIIDKDEEILKLEEFMIGYHSYLRFTSTDKRGNVSYQVVHDAGCYDPSHKK